MKSLPQWGAVFVSAAPLGAWGLGLGDIELQSALNQPLEAEIALTSATAEELESLRVALASNETYQRFGAERPSELTSVRFAVTRNDAGRNVIRVTSQRPIVDPFLTMLVEVSWPSGRTLREYTVLLDPPLYSPDINAAPPVRQAQTATPEASSGAIDRPPQQASTSSAPSASRAAASTPAAVAAAPRNAGGTGVYGPVARNETLWEIARALRPTDVSVNQMMVGLYEANPSAFDGNMNVLRRGATLTVPERDQLLATAAAAATAAVRQHELSWQGARQAAQPATPPPAEQAQARLRLVPAVTNSAGASADAVAGEAAEGAVPGAPGGDSPSSDAEVARLRSEVESLRGELDESRRLLELRDEQLRELQASLEAADEAEAAATATEETPDAATETTADGEAEAEGVVAPGVELESEQLFVDEEPVEPAEETAAAAAAAAAAPAATRVVTPTPEPQPSLLARVFGFVANPLLLIGLGIGAVLLTAVWYLRNRRDDVDEVTGKWDALDAERTTTVADDTQRLRREDLEFPVDDVFEEAELDEQAAEAGAPVSAVSPELDVDDTLSSQTVINLDQGDALAEADFHMAYGLYDQAADLVLKALEAEPHRRDLMLKLIEVYFVWGNKDAFLDTARELHAEIGGGADRDWDKVLIMGKQICPDETLFAESAGGGSVDVDLQGEGATSLDFAFDSSVDADVDAAAEDLSGATGSTTGLDFDLAETGEQLGGFDSPLELSSEDGEPGDGELHTFDDSLGIGEQTAAGLEAALFVDDGGDESTAEAEFDIDEYALDEDDVAALATDVDLSGFDPQESPTTEREGVVDSWDEDAFAAETPSAETYGADAPTIESPSVAEPAAEGLTLETSMVEAFGSDAPTVETPAFEAEGSEAPTVETPTIEAAGSEAPTVETPTIEAEGSEAPTVETPTIEAVGSEAPTVETPTIDAAGPEAPTVESPMIDTNIAGTERIETPTFGDAGEQLGGESTQEIDLDDLGLNLENLPEEVEDFLRADDGDTREQPRLDVNGLGVDAGDDLLSASGVTEVLGDEEIDAYAQAEDDIETTQTEVLGDRGVDAVAHDNVVELSGTEVLPERHVADGTGSTSLLRALDRAGNGLDLELDDLASALDGDTLEQPRAAGAVDVFDGEADTPLDLDIGVDDAGDEDFGPLDPQTMTEIGTKLDLARAYIDMGDPEGAKSILEEVLDEGDTGQRREAQGLMDVLSA